MYRWTIQDVFELLGVRYNPNRVEVEVDCPFCGKRHFGMNMKKGIGHCWSCSQTADSASFYAASTGLSLYEARKDIENRLNIGGDAEPRPERIVFETPKEAEIAPLDVRDKTYRRFLEELHLSEKNLSMLLARGFNRTAIESLGYKTFPSRSEVNYFDLCRRLQADGCILEGVPGFFKTKKGDFTFVQLTKGIIMPSLTRENKIAYLQVRKDDDLRIFNEDKGELEAKCSWFSSRGLNAGSKASAEVHYACDMRYSKEHKTYYPVVKDTVLLTEGIMKGDLIHDIMPQIPVITVAGVNNYLHLRDSLRYLKGLGVKNVMHCFDMDYRTNKNVEKAMQEIKKIIEEEGLIYIFRAWETKIQVDGKILDLLNGLDDFLAYKERGIIPKIVK